MAAEEESPIPFDELDEPIEVAEDGKADAGRKSDSQIRAFDRGKSHGDHWDRTPNVTGQGAIHVKTFCAKLRPDALEYMDQQINEWLDAHPEYEVKMTTSSIGELHGKTNEPALVLNVWV